MNISIFFPNMTIKNGVGRTLINLANELTRQNHHVNILLPEGQGALGNLPNVSIVRLARNTGRGQWQATYLHMMRRRLKYMHKDSEYLYTQAISDHLRKHKPDIFLCADVESSLAGAIAMRAMPAAERPVAVCSLHIRFDRNTATGLKYFYVRHSRRALLDHMWLFRAITAPSRGMAQRLRQVMPAYSKIVHYIPNAIVNEAILRDSKLAPTHNWLTHNPEGIPVIVAAGRLCKQKAFDDLLEGFFLANQSRKLRLLIYGPDQGMDNQLTRLIKKLDLADNVRIAGFSENLHAELAAASVFVLSSRWETFGNVLVEALAVGTPCVSTDCDFGPREILDGGKYGALVSPGDPQALAHAILSECDKARSGNDLKARGRVFDGQNSVREHLKLFAAIARS